MMLRLLTLFVTLLIAAAAPRNLRTDPRQLYSINAQQIISLFNSGAWDREGVRAYLNVFCQAFAGRDCWGPRGTHRELQTSTSFDSAALLAEYPDNQPETFSYTQDDLQSWLAAGEWSSFAASDGHHVRFVKLVGGGQRGALVVSPGQSEPIMKYAETLRSYQDFGYSPIFCIDHVAQGTSDRLLADHFKQHVGSRSQFVEAFGTFVDRALQSVSTSTPRFLACHSMGCAVAFTLLIEDYEAERETRFNAVVANAPLIKADTSPFPYPIATAIGEVMVGVGLGEEYAPTREETFVEAYGNQNFATATTSSLERWVRQRDLCVAASDQHFGVDQHKGICLGGLTANFAREFFKMYDKFDTFNHGKGKVSTPTLIQIAGDPGASDGLVQNSETTRFCGDGLKHCETQSFPSSKHNIWWEKDAIRGEALGSADAFLQSHVGPPKTPQCPLPPTCGRWKWSWFSSGCADPSLCSYQFQFGDLGLGASCRPRSDVC